MPAGKLDVQIWSDVVCPWCAIGKRRLEQALERFDHAGEVRVTWRSFELDPSAPALQPGDNADRLATKYGRTRDEALAMMQQVQDTAARDGLDLRLAAARSGNTFDAHRLLHWAALHDLQGALKARLLRGYMTEGEAIGDRDALVRLAADVGLDSAEARDVLQSDRFAEQVRGDERAARSLGIRGVPFFVFGGKYAVSGAQPSDLLLEVLEKTWTDAADAAVG